MNLEQKYNEYMHQLGINESKLHPNQRRENRNAFFAGATTIVLGLSRCSNPAEFVRNAANDINQYYKDEVLDSAERIIRKHNKN